MPWRKKGHDCGTPLFWSFRAVGRIWECGDCGSLYVIHSHTFGKAFVLIRKGNR